VSNYILDENNNPISCNDIKKWGKWFQVNDKTVSFTEKNGIRVSTVFLGLDHQYGEGEPILFETMIFGGKEDQYQERYSSYKDAEKGHIKACKLAGF